MAKVLTERMIGKIQFALDTLLIAAVILCLVILYRRISLTKKKRRVEDTHRFDHAYRHIQNGIIAATLAYVGLMLWFRGEYFYHGMVVVALLSVFIFIVIRLERFEKVLSVSLEETTESVSSFPVFQVPPDAQRINPEDIDEDEDEI